ncbi:MAG: DUF2802 domain-containing protein [Steroidobacteraceae bacterium]|jgi:hypothetical protein|nr:DUF2802 domain-containing protein [Steroidobacteraceae bacterium]
MPDLPQLTFELLYAIAAAACAGLAAAGLLGLGRARARAAEASLERLRGELAALRHENGSQSATLATLAGRLDALQRQLAADARHAAPAPGAAPGSAFELAIRLARGGATSEELMSACLMSRHEAELAIRLHGGAGRAPAGRLAAVR